MQHGGRIYLWVRVTYSYREDVSDLLYHWYTWSYYVPLSGGFFLGGVCVFHTSPTVRRKGNKVVRMWARPNRLTTTWSCCLSSWTATCLNICKSYVMSGRHEKKRPFRELRAQHNFVWRDFFFLLDGMIERKLFDVGRDREVFIFPARRKLWSLLTGSSSRERKIWLLCRSIQHTA